MYDVCALAISLNLSRSILKLLPFHYVLEPIFMRFIFVS